MKNLNKLAALVAFSALASLASAQTIDNWRNANGDVWKTPLAIAGVTLAGHQQLQPLVAAALL